MQLPDNVTLYVDTVDYELSARYDDRPGVNAWRLDISMDDGPEFYPTFADVLDRVAHLEHNLPHGAHMYAEFLTSTLADGTDEAVATTRRLLFLSALASYFPEFEYSEIGVYWVYDKGFGTGWWALGFDDDLATEANVHLYAQADNGEQHHAIAVARPGLPGNTKTLGAEHVKAAAAALANAKEVWAAGVKAARA